MNEMKADEILDKAVELLDGGNKWVQCTVETSRGYCSIGAISTAALGHAQYLREASRYPEAMAAQHALAKVFEEQFPSAWSESQTDRDEEIVVRGNDASGRTAEEVIACMEKAAINLRSHVED